MNRIFVTGFPGFLTRALLPWLAGRGEGTTSFDCLVESRFEDKARRDAEYFSRKWGCEIRVVTGNISRPDLGLGSGYGEIASRCGEIFHLAAVYDLAVPLEVATAVNVEGTRHVLDLAAACDSLDRFHHVSTCYVSGRFTGIFREHDLEAGQTFGNHYESTKFVSEVLVQEAAVNGLSTTIYRPSIVCGDSKTGRAQKMDGPYFFIQWLLHQPRVAVLPVFRGSDAATMNIVPSDYVTRAIAFLSTVRDRPMSVFSLADPSPLSIRELTRLLASATRRKVLRIPATKPLARAMIRTVCRLHPRLDIPPQAIDYLSHPTRYDCTNALSALQGSGIECPPFGDYVDHLVAFVEKSIDSDR